MKIFHIDSVVNLGVKQDSDSALVNFGGFPPRYHHAEFFADPMMRNDLDILADRVYTAQTSAIYGTLTLSFQDLAQKDSFFTQYSKKYKCIEAAGGLVLDAKGRMMLIYKRNRWDLPKGKIDSGENTEQTALREVEEETGVSGLTILDTLPTTYHVFPKNDEWRMKITHWYLMHAREIQHAKPQTEEDIELIEWFSKETLFINLAHFPGLSIYPSIKHLLLYYFDKYPR